MNILGFEFKTKSEKQAEEEKRLNIAVDLVVNAVNPINNYNQAIYGWLNNNQPVFYNDRARTYVEDGYMGNQDVYSCIDKIITKLAMCPAILYEVNNENLNKLKQFKNLRNSPIIEAKVKAKILEVKNLKEVYHPNISKILNKPNPMDEWADWVKQWGGYYLITGNAYNYLNGPNPDKSIWSEMFVLPSHFTEIVSGGAFQPIKGYRLLGQGYYYQSENIAFTANQVVHSKTFNPDYTTVGTQLYGMSPLKAYLLTLYKNKISRVELTRQAKNGGVSGFISPKDAPSQGSGLTATQRDDLKEQIKRAKSGEELVERIFASSGPLVWQQIGLPSVEMELLKSLDVDQKDIYTCFRVPITMANNMEASTDNNVAMHAKQFVYNAVMPLANELGSMLTRALCAPLNKDSNRTGKYYEILIDTSSLPEMQEDMYKVAQWLQISDDLTPNEKREVKGFARSSNPGADELWMDSNKVLMKDAMTTDAEITGTPNPNDPLNPENAQL